MQPARALPAGGSQPVHGPSGVSPSGHGACDLPAFVNPEYAVGAGLAVLLTIYLVYALLRPEKF